MAGRKVSSDLLTVLDEDVPGVAVQVLMRALRDFNIPKIVADDMPVFMGLIGDLFPSLDVPRKRDMDFEKMVRQATLDQKLQPEDNFILKVNLSLLLLLSSATVN